MRIHSDGNIGINSTAPREKLDISAGRIILDQDYQFTWANGTTNRARIYGDSGNNFIVETGSSNTERLRIKTDGYVGIGTNNPERMLHINHPTNAVIKMEGSYSGSVTGIEGVLTASGANRYVTGVYGKVINTSGTESNVANIRLWNEQSSPTTSDSPGYITFSTTNDGASSSTEKVRITSGGSVGIGTENPESDQLLTIHGTSNYKAGIRLRQSSTNIFKLIPEGGTGNVYYDVYGISNLLVGDHIFRVKNGQEKLRINSSGNVGIASATPAARLDVYKDFNGIGAGTYAGRVYGLDLGVDETGVRFVTKGTGDLHNASDAYLMHGISNGTTRFVFGANGKVGIGDDNPDVPFNVKAGGASFAGQTTHVKIEDTTSLAANVGGLLAFEGVYNTNGDPACYAMIHGGKTNADTGNYSGYLRFLTRPSNALPQERLRITSSGVVGINTDASGNDSGAKLVVGGRIQSNAGGYWFAGANGAEDGWHVQDSGGNLTVVESGVAERLRITSDGYVGINETSPDTYLHVKTGTDSALAKLEQTATNGRVQVQYLSPHGDLFQE